MDRSAEKERDYANDNMQKLYNSYIGNCDTYLNKVNLALTDVGSKGQSLALTKNRMSNEQETMEELKSKNEDRELSDIILEYTAAYTAYQSPLQGSFQSKSGDITQLSVNYINSTIFRMRVVIIQTASGGKGNESEHKAFWGDRYR